MKMTRLLTASNYELPRSFISAMRMLFDIMDDQATGYISYSEIEALWRDDGSSGLPKGVLEGLKSVTPANGILSFDAFCTGLKASLLASQAKVGSREADASQRNRSASASSFDVQKQVTWTSCNTAAVRPNNIIPQQRTFSMPQLAGEDARSSQANADSRSGNQSSSVKVNAAHGPPKPPRTGAAVDRIFSPDRNFNNLGVCSALPNWKARVTMNNKSALEALQVPNLNQEATKDVQVKKPFNRRREPRRHTLQSGIDYNMLKKIKQVEQEKELLIQGLNAVESAKDWYLKQISITQDKIKQLGRMGSHTELWTEAQQEKLELQRARIAEVNRHLATLISSWEKGALPFHINLAFASTPAPTQQQQTILKSLKQQNQMLTEEVSKKNHKILVLEQEKSSLVRDLYEINAGIVRSRRPAVIHEQHDKTLII